MSAVDANQRWAFVRNIKLYRPYPDEVPWPLFDQHPGHLSAEQLDVLVAAAQADQKEYFLRVAKLDDEVVGAYLIRRLDPSSFQLEYLAVAQAQRRRGVGRWLTGHAIGIAESKGGRRLICVACAAQRFLECYGFVTTQSGQVFEFVPE